MTEPSKYPNVQPTAQEIAEFNQQVAELEQGIKMAIGEPTAQEIAEFNQQVAELEQGIKMATRLLTDQEKAEFNRQVAELTKGIKMATGQPTAQQIAEFNQQVAELKQGIKMGQALLSQPTDQEIAEFNQEVAELEQGVKMCQDMGSACMVINGVLCLVQSTVFCAMYWEMWADAEDLGKVDGTYVYDTCGNPDWDTKWSVLLQFNAYMNLVMTILTVLQMVGTYVSILAILSACGNCCAGSAYFAMIIVTGVFRFSGDGDKCEKSGVLNDDADKIKGLFIAQCVLYIGYWVCLGLVIQSSIMTSVIKKARQASKELEAELEAQTIVV